MQCTALKWKSAHIPSPLLSNPEQYGWKWNIEMHLYDAVMTKLLPTPESIIRCIYLKNGRLKRTGMCKCGNCKNVELKDLINFHDHDLKENEELEQ